MLGWWPRPGYERSHSLNPGYCRLKCASEADMAATMSHSHWGGGGRSRDGGQAGARWGGVGGWGSGPFGNMGGKGLGRGEAGRLPWRWQSANPVLPVLTSAGWDGRARARISAALRWVMASRGSTYALNPPTHPPAQLPTLPLQVPCAYRMRLGRRVADGRVSTSRQHGDGLHPRIPPHTHAHARTRARAHPPSHPPHTHAHAHTQTHAHTLTCSLWSAR